MSRRLPGAWILQAATEASRLPQPRQGAGRRSDRPEVLRAAATAPDRFVPGARHREGHRGAGHPALITSWRDVPEVAWRLDLAGGDGGEPTSSTAPGAGLRSDRPEVLR